MNEPATQSTSTDQQPRKTLRLALALRGGVSLAVWIGGAVAELDLFRRASLRDTDGNHLDRDLFPVAQRARVELYRDLLTKNDYRTVEIDILAGASAGGLNAVLLGLAQSRGVPLDDIASETWINEGAIWKLLRKPGCGFVRSIMTGDGAPNPDPDADDDDNSNPHGFYPLAREAMNKIVTDSIGQGDDAFAVTTVSVDVAATVVSYGYEEKQTKTPGADPAVTHKHRAGFTFTSRPGGITTAFSTIPHRTDNPTADQNPEATIRFNAKLDLMALAIRSTSSYPGAFEPASIYSVEEHYAIPDGGMLPVADSRTHKTGLFQNAAACFPMAESLENLEDATPFMVIDGGLFDNIPIDRAVRAIQRAPAAGPTERRLFYLDPSPPAKVEDPYARAADAAWLSILLRAANLKIRQESAKDELSLIHRHNTDILKQRSRAEGFADALNAAPDLEGPPAYVPSDAAYTEARIGADVDRFVNFLSAPWDELCVPPRSARPLAPISPEHALKVKDAVGDAYGVTSEGILVANDIQAAIDCTYLLILWAREVEESADEINNSIGNLKARLYRTLAVLIEARREAVYLPLAAIVPASSSESFEIALTNRLMESSTIQTDRCVTAGLWGLVSGPTPENEAEFFSMLAEEIIAEPVGDPLLPTVWSLLSDATIELRTACPLPPGPDEYSYWTKPMWLIAASAPPESVAQRITKAMSAIGLTDMSMIKYHAIRGDNLTRQRGSENSTAGANVAAPSAAANGGAGSNAATNTSLQSLTESVRKADRISRLSTWLANAPRGSDQLDAWKASISATIEDSDGRVAPSSKLAGARLANFAGFLDWRWRENDWRWGRLDAASGIVEAVAEKSHNSCDLCASGKPCLLCELCRLREMNEMREMRENTVRELQSNILAESPQDSYSGFSPGDISGTYRYGLAARIGPLISRACLPKGKARWTATGLLQSFGGILLRMLFVPLILFAQPVRLAAVVATFIAMIAAAQIADPHAAAYPSTATTSTMTSAIVCGLLLAIAAFLSLTSVWSSRRRWQLLDIHLVEAHDSTGGDVYIPWRRDLRSSYPALALLCQWTCGIFVLTAGIVLIVYGSFTVVPLSAIAYAALVIAGIAAVIVTGAQAKRMSRPTASRTASDWLPSIAASVISALAIGLCVASSMPNVAFTGRAGAVAAGVASFCLWWLSLQGWAEHWLVFVLPAVAGLVTAAVLWCATPALYVALVPALVWIVVLGLIIGVIPVRMSKYGEVAAP